MQTYLDAKTMAKALRQGLAQRGIALSHSDCLELVARQFGLANWNMLAARIEAASLPLLPLPEGWFVSHPSPEYYRIGLDPAQPGVVLVASQPNVEIPGGQTGVIMQSIDAISFRGLKLRFSAELRTEEAGSGSIWMRVDPAAGRFLRFDNMLQRGDDAALHGTLDWKAAEVVLDVPDAAASIHYGLLLVGEGRLWARNLRIEPVDGDSPVTSVRPFPLAPTNLGFSVGLNG
ncbi:glyoxalase superfamily protein [Devosia sp. Root635]|uniref:glyoxalase superfamily protein n=1 Tax=Devosia sp. Root635 TaxID=1736575 RepID=UPI0009EA054F|nr:glyoxalase superfamily protein [Devosia sp. Root635]